MKFFFLRRCAFRQDYKPQLLFQFLLRVEYQLACLIFFFLLTMVVCKVSHYMCEMRGINRIYRTVVKKINK
jgi:hypothetical protein